MVGAACGQLLRSSSSPCVGPIGAGGGAGRSSPPAIVAVVGVVLAATVPPVEAVGGAGAGGPGDRAADSATCRSPSRPARRVDAADPLRAWILGDSVMADSAPGVTAALEATGDVQVVADSAFGGWGLSTDQTWATDLPRIIAQYHPEIVIGTWSWDDDARPARPPGVPGRVDRRPAHHPDPGRRCRPGGALAIPSGRAQSLRHRTL